MVRLIAKGGKIRVGGGQMQHSAETRAMLSVDGNLNINLAVALCSG